MNDMFNTYGKNVLIFIFQNKKVLNFVYELFLNGLLYVIVLLMTVKV